MFGRHSLVWLTDAGWDAAGTAAAPEACEAIAGWRSRKWPAVVRRTEEDAGHGVICAGISLPPADGGKKIRFPLRVNAAQVLRAELPLRLDAVIPSLPAWWQAGLSRLGTEAAQHGIDFRVYGSAAWQALTGIEHVTPSSDVDLLFYPATRADLDTGLRLLSAASRHLPLDGEAVFPSAHAVAWKEWQNAVQSGSRVRVLAKHTQSVRLLPADELLGQLIAEPWPAH